MLRLTLCLPYRPWCYWSCLCCCRMLPTVKTCINHSFDQHWSQRKSPKKIATPTIPTPHLTIFEWSHSLCAPYCPILEWVWKFIDGAWTMATHKKWYASKWPWHRAHSAFIHEYYFLAFRINSSQLNKWNDLVVTNERLRKMFPQLKCQSQPSRQSETIKHWLNQ